MRRVLLSEHCTQVINETQYHKRNDQWRLKHEAFLSTFNYCSPSLVLRTWIHRQPWASRQGQCVDGRLVMAPELWASWHQHQHQHQHVRYPDVSVRDRSPMMLLFVVYHPPWCCACFVSHEDAVCSVTWMMCGICFPWRCCVICHNDDADQDLFSLMMLCGFVSLHDAV